MPDTKTAVVTDGVAIFDTIEADIVTIRTAVESLIDIIDRGEALNMCGNAAALWYKARIDELSDSLSGARGAMLTLHNTLTRVAQANGVDPSGGGTRTVY